MSFKLSVCISFDKQYAKEEKVIKIFSIFFKEKLAFVDSRQAQMIRIFYFYFNRCEICVNACSLPPQSQALESTSGA